MGRRTEKTRAHIFFQSLKVGMVFKARPGYLSMPYHNNTLTLERIGERTYSNYDDYWLYLRTERGEEVDCRVGWLRRFWRQVSE